jgi:uncharacterized membrane protein YtjA (UPF0391 family)
MESKKWYQSRTVIFNIISLVAGVSGWGAGTMTSYPEIVCALVIIQAVGNLVLRRMTSASIKA